MGDCGSAAGSGGVLRRARGDRAVHVGRGRLPAQVERRAPMARPPWVSLERRSPMVRPPSVLVERREKDVANIRPSGVLVRGGS
jgi:hypothetical protein